MYHIREMRDERSVVVDFEKWIEEMRREGWECGRLASSGVSVSGDWGVMDDRLLILVVRRVRMLELCAWGIDGVCVPTGVGDCVD